MSDALEKRFPDLYFDTKEVVELTPKKTPPSIAQVMAKILVGHGIQDNSLASDLGTAAEEFFKSVKGA